MASGIFAILDDIAALMDDVAVAAKMATKKTAGILGDDLAVNAEKATGFLSSREIPVLWAITKYSFLNKLIIIPIVFLLNFYVPIVIKLLLIIGGCYLAYEGMEKIVEFLFHREKKGVEVIKEEESDADAEKKKIKSAVLTDFILSLEIIIIALSSVFEKELNVQIITVCVVGIIATVGVYGIVALIVRMDDAGFKLIKRGNEKGILATIGNLLVKGLPIIIKILSVVGTIALLLVSGGIFDHYVPFMHDWLSSLPEMLQQAIFGISVGLLMVFIITPVKKLIAK